MPNITDLVLQMLRQNQGQQDFSQLPSPVFNDTFGASNIPLPNPFDPMNQPSPISNLSLTPQQLQELYGSNQYMPNPQQTIDQGMNFLGLVNNSLGNNPQSQIDQLIAETQAQQRQLKKPGFGDAITGLLMSAFGGAIGSEQLLNQGINYRQSKELKYENAKDKLKAQENELRFTKYRDDLSKQNQDRNYLLQSQQIVQEKAGQMALKTFDLANTIEARRLQEESEIRIQNNADLLRQKAQAIQNGQQQMFNRNNDLNGYLKLGLPFEDALRASNVQNGLDSNPLTKNEMALINKKLKERSDAELKAQELDSKYKGIQVQIAEQSLGASKQGSGAGLINQQQLQKNISEYGVDEGYLETLRSNNGKLTTGNDDYDKEIESLSKQYNVPVKFIIPLIAQESSGNPNAQSKDKYGKPIATGLMQLTEDTARRFLDDGEQLNLKDPKQNLKLGIKYLRFLMDRYQGDEDFNKRVLIGYNAGEGKADSYDPSDNTVLQNGKRVPLGEFSKNIIRNGKAIAQTDDYVKKILPKINAIDKFLGTDAKGEYILEKRIQENAIRVQKDIDDMVRSEQSKVGKTVDDMENLDSFGKPGKRKYTQEEANAQIYNFANVKLAEYPELKDNQAIRNLMNSVSKPQQEQKKIDNTVFDAAKMYIDKQLASGIPIDNVLAEIDSNEKLKQFSKELRIYARSKPKFSKSEIFVNKNVDSTQPIGTKKELLGVIESNKAGQGNYSTVKEPLADDIFLNMMNNMGKQK